MIKEVKYCDFCGKKVKSTKQIYVKGFTPAPGRIEFDACDKCYEIIEPLAIDMFKKMRALGDAYNVCVDELKTEFSRRALSCFDDEQVKVCEGFYETVRTLEKQR